MSHNLLEAFQAAVLLGAERPAIITPARTLSYGELDRLSDKWAGALQQQPRAQIGARVAIALPNGIESVIAMWAAIKSGLVLLPIDLKWPAAGIQRVLSEVEPAIWIGENLPPDSGALTPFTPAELCQSTHVFEPRPLAPDRMLALFYTSGSSGEPKAVALDQDCLWHGAKNYHRALALSPEDRVSWTAPFAYGAAIGVTLPTLTIGAALIPWQPTEHPVAEWIEWLKTCRVSVIMIVTSLFRTIASHLPDGENLPHLRLIKIGGEAAHPGDAELFARRFHHDCALINGLGITEIGANVCFHTWARGSAIPPPTLPLGHAAAGIELLIADENGNLLPAGGEGEILVRSKWMARGYWTRSGIINERFAPLPDDTTPTYRTGDLGRILPDGSLQHLGSLSTQLKIRGYRVEAIEVESAIRSLSGINEAAVNVRTWSDAPKLVAWITGPDADQWTATHIRKELRSRLADYMLPTLVCALPELPKSINGKIDRKALAESPLKVHARSQTIDDPLERQIGKIWEKLLGIQGIGRTDNFFDLGGDSLMAMSLLNQLERKLGVELPMIHISNCPTIELMAGQVRTNAAPSQRAILLEAGNDTTTVFCIPGAGLDVSTLMELASHLAPVASVYGLQLPGLDGFSNPAPTVEAMAAQFLPEVLRIQPVGPYHFIGISFGGRVAVELVQLLLERGEQVTTLAFADTFGPGVPTLRPGLSLLRRLRARWLLFAGEGPRWRLRHYRRILKRLREIVLLLRANRWLYQGRPIEKMPRELRPFYSFRLARKASLAHNPGPVGTPVILFTPEVEFGNSDFEMTNDRGWAPIADAGLKIIRVPGKHANMFRNPYAEILASHLAAHIRKRLSISAADEAIVQQTEHKWDELANWWDEQVGQDGESPAARALAPAVDRFLGATTGMHVLELACGNGWYARRLAAQGVRVIATDFSGQFLQRAASRVNPAAAPITYQKLNTALLKDWMRLSDHSMDAAVCNMGLMDMADISLLFPQLSRILKPGAPFVFSIINPDSAGLRGTVAGQQLMWIGIPGQPAPHTMFHRPLSEITSAAEAAGFTLEQTAPHQEGKTELLVLQLRLSPNTKRN